MDEFFSGEDSGSEFNGYITDEEVEDEVDRRDDAPNHFFKTNHCTLTALLLFVKANHLQRFSHQMRLSLYSRLHKTKYLQPPAPLQLLAAHFILQLLLQWLLILLHLYLPPFLLLLLQLLPWVSLWLFLPLPFFVRLPLLPLSLAHL